MYLSLFLTKQIDYIVLVIVYVIIIKMLRKNVSTYIYYTLFEYFVNYITLLY